ncbi:MAG: ABC transporter ATP-binding protein [Desulfobacula sp.]|jgi:branched-chain amino acid transport system ATP-binding protein
MNAILETRSIQHRFGGWRVLEEVNLSVKTGERHAVLGPNGAGKTTLFNLITGRYKPTSGRILLEEKDITSSPVHQRVRDGLVRSFQITNIFPKLTAFETLRASVLSRRNARFNFLSHLSHMKTVNEEVDKLLEQLSLQDQRDIPSEELAYGQQRALEIGLALALHPKVLLLDEPTAGMSNDETYKMIDLIRKATEGITLVIIEHDMNVVFMLADRISVLHFGKVLICGTQEEVKNNPKVKEAYLGEEMEP